MNSLKDLPITAKIGLIVGAGILGFIIYKKILVILNCNYKYIIFLYNII